MYPMKYASVWFERTVRFAAALFFTLLTAGAADGAYLGTDRQLFVDNVMVAGAANVDFTLHQPTKHAVDGVSTPVLVADRPWETTVALYGTAIYDEQDKLYKMWYRTTSDTCYICYATSADGVTWTKPNLGLTTFQGSKNNNIVAGFDSFYNDGFGVYKDQSESDPSRRYKLFTYYQSGTTKSFAAMTSADGVNWSGPVNTPTYTSGDVVSMYYDTGLKKYVGLTKLYINGKRSRQITYSSDFNAWTAPTTILTPDSQDPSTVHFYSQTAYMYGGMRIGYLTIYDTATEKIDTQLVTSRDGYKWNRSSDRTAFIPNGAAGEFDSALALAGCSGLIIDDDKISIYYTGSNRDHAGNVIGGGEAAYGIGLATLRKDGFVSADADAGGGTLATKPFRLCSLDLSINAATAAAGNVRVELLDAAGQVIAGYGAAQSSAFNGDSLDAGVTWSGQKIDRSLLGQKVSLRFNMQSASLYSYGFRDIAAYVAAFDDGVEGWTGNTVVWSSSGGQEGGYVQGFRSDYGPYLTPSADSPLFGDVASNLGGHIVTVSYYLKKISGASATVSLLMFADADGNGTNETIWQWTPEYSAAPTDWTQYTWTVDTTATDGELPTGWTRISGDGSWADSWRNVGNWNFWSCTAAGLNVNGIDTLVAAAVPEPGTFALLLIALGIGSGSLLFINRGMRKKCESGSIEDNYSPD